MGEKPTTYYRFGESVLLTRGEIIAIVVPVVIGVLLLGLWIGVTAL